MKICNALLTVCLCIFSFSAGAETDSSYQLQGDDYFSGTAISGPTPEQEAMYSPAFAGYVDGYVSAAVRRQLNLNSGRVNSLNAQIAKLRATIEELNASLTKRMDQNVEDLQKTVNALKKIKVESDSNYMYIKNIQKELEKVGVTIEDHRKSLNQATADLENKIDNSRSEMDVFTRQIDGQVTKKLNDSSEFETRAYSIFYTIGILCIICIVLTVIAFAYALRGSFKLAQSKKDFDRLNEDFKKLKQQSEAKTVPVPQMAPAPQPQTQAVSVEVDHSLMIKLAEDLAHMENKLLTLDKSSKEYLTLLESMNRIRDSAREKGYEFIGYTGEEYKVNMPCEADFLRDESIEPGKSIITTMLRMQVNYKGSMVQKPKFVVKQNLTY